MNYEEEKLTPVQQYNEYILTSLRTIWGTDTKHIENKFGKKALDQFLKEIVPFLSNGTLRKEGNKIVLTDGGKLLADKIASDLFMEQKEVPGT